MPYQTYRDLPPLAGLCSMEEAQRPGLSVEECVTRLKRFHYCFKRLHGVFTARITAEPIYELKTAFSHHAYLCAEHATALRKRVGEMREPPLGLEDVPHEALDLFFDEILCAPSTEAPSSNGLEIARRAASSARSFPSAVPVPIIASPLPDMIVFTSAKSRLIRPGTRIRSEIP